METCKYCGKEFKNKKGVSVHRRYNEDCYQKWEKEQKEIEKKRLDKGYVICEICGRKMKTITNTHLKKHDITMNEYIYKYGEVFSNDVLLEQRKNREKTLHERYTEEELKYLRGEKSIKSKLEKHGFTDYSALSKHFFDKSGP